MLSVWKYPLNSPDARIEMPRGAKILCVQMQNGVPTLWALVDPIQPTEGRNFFTVGTGLKLPSKFADFTYIGTIQASGYVWHVFEEQWEEDHGKE